MNKDNFIPFEQRTGVYLDVYGVRGKEDIYKAKVMLPDGRIKSTVWVGSIKLDQLRAGAKVEAYFFDKEYQNEDHTLCRGFFSVENGALIFVPNAPRTTAKS